MKPGIPGPARRGILAGALAAGCCAGPSGLEAVVPRDQAPFEADPRGALHTLLEKTLLQVNVLTLDVQVDSVTAEEFAALAADTRLSGDRYDEAIARALLGAPEAWVRMEFLRSVGQKRFLQGIRENLDHAAASKIITGAHRDRVVAQLPVWYDFLASRGVKKGDVLVYHVRGDSLRTSYHGVEGAVLFDYVQGDSLARFGVLGGFVTPGSDFRTPLARYLRR